MVCPQYLIEMVQEQDCWPGLSSQCFILLVSEMMCVFNCQRDGLSLRRIVSTVQPIICLFIFLSLNVLCQEEERWISMVQGSCIKSKIIQQKKREEHSAAEVAQLPFFIQEFIFLVIQCQTPNSMQTIVVFDHTKLDPDP